MSDSSDKNLLSQINFSKIKVDPSSDGLKYGYKVGQCLKNGVPMGSSMPLMGFAFWNLKRNFKRKKSYQKLISGILFCFKCCKNVKKVVY